jgi:hypothetical protein
MNGRHRLLKLRPELLKMLWKRKKFHGQETVENVLPQAFQTIQMQSFAEVPYEQSIRHLKRTAASTAWDILSCWCVILYGLYMDTCSCFKQQV